MRGLVKIKEWVNAKLPWAKKDNELIQRANLPWGIDIPVQLGTPGLSVDMSDQKVTINLTQMTTITFVGCDENGVQWKFTAFGVKEELAP